MIKVAYHIVKIVFYASTSTQQDTALKCSFYQIVVVDTQSNNLLSFFAFLCVILQTKSEKNSMHSTSLHKFDKPKIC